MSLKRLTVGILLVYAVLTVYTIARMALGLPFIGGMTPLMTGLAFIFAFLHAGQRMGWLRAGLLVVVTFAVALLFESVGVATGVVYGPYHYTERLGPKFLGLVPYLIPLAWFMMMLPSFLMARWLLPAKWTGWKRSLTWAALGGVIMTSWDLTMDPMMVAGGHWIWEAPGAYFGVPLQNYWGWWLTTFVSFAVFLALARMERAAPAPNMGSLSRFDRLAIASYLVTGLGNAIAAALTGLLGPALVGGAAMLAWIGLAWRATGREYEWSTIKTVWF